MSQALALYKPNATEAVQTAANNRLIVQELKKSVLIPKLDYGEVGGGGKPTLLKAGAERLCAAFHLYPVYEDVSVIERWDGPDPFFFYRYRCNLMHIETGLQVGSGIGSCNSKEDKYGWRWVSETSVPKGLDLATLEARSGDMGEFDFAIKEGATSGKYGKPAEHWQKFRDALASGNFRAETVNNQKTNKPMTKILIGGTLYRIPNADPFSIVNTLDKMAAKRALIAAVLVATNASAFFTQDIEDMPGFHVDTAQNADDVVEGEIEELHINRDTGEIEHPAPAQPRWIGGWLQAPGAEEKILQWAFKAFKLNAAEVLEAARLIDPNTPRLVGMNITNDDIMAAIVAYVCGLEDVEIGKCSSSLAGLSDDTKLKVDTKARALAAGERARLSDAAFNDDAPEEKAPKQPIQGRVYDDERVQRFLGHVDEKGRVAHWNNLWKKLVAQQSIPDEMIARNDVEELVGVIAAYYAHKGNNKFEDLPSAPRVPSA